ncbi:MAG: glycosyltransferase, partial [Chlorobi bacterium]|nr:glycosyltransferase [Chlorobiota bacterium]
QAADALMIPSHEGHEGMPRVLYESISCGTVGIGSNTSGVKEAVTPDSGILVEEMTPPEIAAAVKKLMLDPDIVKDLQINGRKRALEFFDIKKHAKSVQDFYTKILNL